MKPLMPKQHGAWAMLIVPFMLGVAAGTPSVWHVPLFIGWLLLYLSSYPLLMVMKNKRKAFHMKWFIGYFGSALLILAIPIYLHPYIILIGLGAIPFFAVNIFFARQNNERSLWNDLSAISILSFGSIASYYVGTHTLDFAALEAWVFSMLFFIGSTFFVKTLIREKRNPTYRWISWGYHIGLLIVLALVDPVMTIAYIPSLFRAIWFYGKTLRPMQIGITEIANSAIFLTVMMILFNVA